MKFEDALDRVLKHEGGYVNDPRDRGGMTNLGVTRRAYEAYLGRTVSEQEMRALTPATVEPFYRDMYWTVAHCDELPSGADYELFDMAVNHGPARAIKLLQRSLDVTSDGVFGSQTRAAVKMHAKTDIINELALQRALFCLKITGDDPFDDGWAARIESVRDAALKNF